MWPAVLNYEGFLSMITHLMGTPGWHNSQKVFNRKMLSRSTFVLFLTFRLEALSFMPRAFHVNV